MKDTITNAKKVLYLSRSQKETDTFTDEQNNDPVVAARQRLSKAINRSVTGDEAGAIEEVRQAAQLLDAELEVKYGGE